MKFEDFVGEHMLSGVDMLMTRVDTWDRDNVEAAKALFVLDGTTYMVLEDPDDGYRSYASNDIQVTEEHCTCRFPEIKVNVEYKSEQKAYIDGESFAGLIFKDVENGEVILELGTDWWDAYYPVCVFRWTPENIHLNDSDRIATTSIVKIVYDDADPTKYTFHEVEELKNEE